MSGKGSFITLNDHAQSSHWTITLNHHTHSSHAMITRNDHTQWSHSTITLNDHTQSCRWVAKAHSFITLNHHTHLSHSMITLIHHTQSCRWVAKAHCVDRWGVAFYQSLPYGVATSSRLLKITGLFCRVSSLLQGSFAKETYNFKEPTHRCHPIARLSTPHLHTSCVFANVV